MGGQGAVVFGHHAEDKRREFAIKFFFRVSDFLREKQLASIAVRSHVLKRQNTVCRALRAHAVLLYMWQSMTAQDGTNYIQIANVPTWPKSKLRSLFHIV